MTNENDYVRPPTATDYVAPPSANEQQTDYVAPPTANSNQQTDYVVSSNAEDRQYENYNTSGVEQVKEPMSKLKGFVLATITLVIGNIIWYQLLSAITIAVAGTITPDLNWWQGVLMATLFVAPNLLAICYFGGLMGYFPRIEELIKENGWFIAVSAWLIASIIISALILLVVVVVFLFVVFKVLASDSSNK